MAGFRNIEGAKQLAVSNTMFALNCYNEIAGDTKQNVFFSPLSISTAMSLVSLGAKSNTALELSSGLCVGKLGDTVHDLFSDFIQAVQNVDPKKSGYNLQTANRLFASNKHTFSDEYKEKCNAFYNADATSLDFAGDGEGSRTTVNEWVMDQTDKKIVDLIPAGMINDQTVMILVNAIYFKGSWANQFDPADTSKDAFYTDADNSIEVDMMFLSSKQVRSGQVENLDCKVVELPYSNENISMLIFLPNENDGLTAMEGKLTTDIITKAYRQLSGMNMVKLHLPKFRLQYQMMVKDLLQSLGIHDAFTPGKADLSGMDGTQELYLTEVVHKAFIDVNEEGTEAAAASGISVGITCMPQLLEMRCDHPFMFMIRENVSGAILFMGRITNPTT